MGSLFVEFLTLEVAVDPLLGTLDGSVNFEGGLIRFDPVESDLSRVVESCLMRLNGSDLEGLVELERLEEFELVDRGRDGFFTV